MGDVELTTEATDQAFSSPDLARIAKHLTEIGIPVRPASLGDDDQLPGVRIEHESLLVDESKLLYPGDVVHEAAHIAVMPPSVRAQVVGALPHEPGEEMAALAWSYALAVTYQLPLEVVFHDAFKAGGPWLREVFLSGGDLGVPLLDYWGMCGSRHAVGVAGLPEFPAMAKWLRDDPPG
jgi:hypothetical protein